MSAVAGPWRATRVGVTGAGGFLGQALVARLRVLGAEPVELSRARGFSLLDEAVELGGLDYVFHLAAETGVLEAWADPVHFHLVNNHGTVRMLDACRRAGIGMTYVGAYIYGVPRTLPIDESHPVDPNNPYAFSKWMGEQSCEWFARVYGVPITAIRLFNVYGPGQSSRFLVSRILEQAMDPAAEQIELMDLNPRRDYLYVDDAVDALLVSRATSQFSLYNVGNGESYSVAEVASLALQAAGADKPVVASGDVRPNEVPDVRADCAKLRAATGWAPRYPLAAGLEEMVRRSRA